MGRVPSPDHTGWTRTRLRERIRHRHLWGVYLGLLLLTPLGCSRGGPALAIGEIDNDYVQIVALLRADTREPLPAEITVGPEEAFVVYLELQEKPDRPSEYAGRPVSGIREHAAEFISVSPGRKPDFRAKPGDIRTVRMGAVALNWTTHRPPTISYIGPAARLLQRHDEQGYKLRKEKLPGDRAGYYTILGAVHKQPGEYTLELYVYPTYRVLPGRFEPGEPLLIWAGVLNIRDQ